ncbi:MAG: hypothetical protein AAGD01_12845 [Acidobacteriota bacterium]
MCRIPFALRSFSWSLVLVAASLFVLHATPLQATPLQANPVNTATSNAVGASSMASPASLNDASDARSYVARAYCLETGELFYTEHHLERWEDGQHLGSEVQYRNPEGEVIAEKSISYTSGGPTPTFEMQDLRDGYREGAEVGPKSVRLYGRNTDGERKESKLRLPRGAVIDAGFHYFIQQEWDALAKGKTRKLDFAIPIRGEFFSFRVRPTGQVKGSDGRQLLKMRFELANPLLRFLADPIQLTYDVERRRLRVYEGRSNIRDDDGKIYTTRIVFAYPDEAGEVLTPQSQPAG